MTLRDHFLILFFNASPEDRAELIRVWDRLGETKE